MDIQRAIRDYITFHEIDNASRHTVRNYRKDLELFADWLQSACGIVDTDDLQLTHLRGWMNYLQKAPSKSGRELSDTTIRQYGVHMQTFCQWLEHEGIIEKPITTRFKLPKVEQKFIPTYTPDDVNRLLAVCDEGGRNRPHLRKALTARNRAIVSVLIDTGLRRQELVGLRLCDVDRELRLLVVHRKGNKWQQVPISREGFKPLHDYLTKYRPQLAKVAGRIIARKEDAVFLADSGEPLTIVGVSKLFYRLQKRAGLEGKKVSPHNCRRYMATTQLAMGRSPLDVQRQMGHTTLQMTNRYASLTVEQLQRSHEEFSPWRARGAGDAGDVSGSGYWDE
jgi:site-specific recombinase XerD